MRELEGVRFGSLKALEGGKNTQSYVLCRCDCGSACLKRAWDLINGKVRSCGECRMSRPDLPWTAVNGAISRCHCKSSKLYKYYGGRGISVHPDWVESKLSFALYLSSLDNFGIKGYSLDRIDNDGNYEPGNLRWASVETQRRNRRSVRLNEGMVRVMRRVHEFMSASEVSRLFNVPHSTCVNALSNNTWKDVGVAGDGR